MGGEAGGKAQWGGVKHGVGGVRQVGWKKVLAPASCPVMDLINI